MRAYHILHECVFMFRFRSLDPIELDPLLNEVKAILNVGELFCAFVRRHLLVRILLFLLFSNC